MSKAAENKSKIDPLLFQLFQTSSSKGDLKKIQIIQSAIRCIASEGIENASYENIGRPLKLTRSHVAYYFKSKDDILLKAIEYVIAKGQALTVERVQNAKTTEDRLVAMVQATFDWAASDQEGFSVYMLFLYYCIINKDYRDLQSKIRSTGANRIQAMLENDPQVSKSRGTKELRELAKALQDLITGAAVDFFTTSEINSPLFLAAKSRASDAVRRVLHNF